MPNPVTFTMHLNDAKVIRSFGPRPWLGKKLPHLTKVTVGVRWSLPKRDHVPDDDVLVHPCIALKPVARGKWRVTVDRQYKQEAMMFLVDHCQ